MPNGPADLRHRSELVLTGAQRASHAAIGLAWAALTAIFWSWWLGHAGGGSPWLYWLQTAALAYQTTVLPAMYWYYVRNMRRPLELRPEEGMRVALITLCVPSSESLEVIEDQLRALVAVERAHDSWILDEGGSSEVEALAQRHGVHYFSRRGIAWWNQPAPPFQAKTKAGNVNAWLDHISRTGFDYDVFVQFDVDHHPRPDYLDRTLGYFRDSEVAWVQAPSVCRNLENWAARGLAEQDLVFQGPLQMGFYGANRMPFIIGSHTSYRTAAIREIGGFQPTRAEDHLDTVVLAAHGYRGVYVPELIATGDGPDDFSTYLRQQFAWAYSMIEIFLRHTPKLIRRYTPRQAVQFLMCQSWYTLWSLSLGLLWILPAIALFTQRPIAAVRFSEFLLYFLPLPLASSFMWCWTRRWFQPGGVRLSWRGALLEVARWPVVLFALANVLLRVRWPYMVTPKGAGERRGPSAISLYGPYVALTALPLLAVWSFRASAGAGAIGGYFGLALANTAIGLVLLATTVGLEVRERAGRVGLRAAVRTRQGTLALTATLGALLAYSGAALWGPITQALS